MSQTAANQTMTALTLNDATGKLALEEAPIPVAADGEVLVRVRAAGVSGVDASIRSGAPDFAPLVASFRERGPVMTGLDFAGTVVEDAAGFKAGERVFGYVDLMEGPRTHAQYVAVPTSSLARMPKNLSFTEAAALPSTALTAIEAVESLASLPGGASVLEIGATGAVGSYATQLANARGARVVGPGTNAVAEADALGLAEVRDTDAPFLDGDAFDFILDTPAHESFEKALPHLAKDGTYVTTQPAADEAGFALAATVPQNAGMLMVANTTLEKLDHLARYAEDGTIAPAVDSVFPLDRANEAFDRALARGKKGRVVLDLGDDD